MQLPAQPTQVGQPTAQAQQIINAIEEVYAPPTTYRDETPLPSVGPTPPVPQPGQAPMSQWAIDASGILRGVAVASLPVGTGLWLVGQVEPLTLGIIFGSPVALALAVGRLVSHIKNAVEAAPPTVHNHYEGQVTVDQRSITSRTTGVIASSRETIR